MWRRWAGGLTAALLLLLAGWWALSEPGDGSQEAATPIAAAASAATPAPAPSRPPSGPAAVAPPFTAAAEQLRLEQHQRWQARLEQAEATLRNYREATRYPPTSQPLRRHIDQAYPNAPIVEDHALADAKGRTSDGVKLRTSQERVFVQGDESVRFTVALQDDAGKSLPLRIVRAGAREMPPPNTASLYPVVPMNFNDEGTEGDLAAGDGTFSALLRPSVQGFAGLAGQIRVELVLQAGDREGPLYFDIFYTPRPPASWQGGVREAVENGSLNLYLGIVVQEPGRYVVSGRVDDASGVPFALLGFNEELEAGPQEIRLTVFGGLLRDARPVFPLTLRDVDAFLLRPDSFPDRSLMPRRAGPVYTTKDHALASFADAEWQSETRERYLKELGRDVAQARAQVERFGGRR